MLSERPWLCKLSDAVGYTNAGNNGDDNDTTYYDDDDDDGDDDDDDDDDGYSEDDNNDDGCENSISAKQYLAEIWPTDNAQNASQQSG